MKQKFMLVGCQVAPALVDLTGDDPNELDGKDCRYDNNNNDNDHDSDGDVNYDDDGDDDAYFEQL